MMRLIMYLFLLLFWTFGCGDTSTNSAFWEQHMQAGDAAYQRGQYEEALQQFDRALKEAETFGEGDPRYATTLNNLAELYRTQGRYTEAEQLHNKALAIWEKALGPQHPHIGTALSYLAEVYRAQARYVEAEHSTNGRWPSGRRC